MKKVIILVVICAVVLENFCCAAIIQNDFYLDNLKYATERKPRLILPNTLRIEIGQGESYELFADAEGEEENLLWETVGAGVIELYPESARCTVFGKGVGEDKIRISIDGEDEVFVDVSVGKQPEVMQRSFEIKAEEEKKSPFSEKLMHLIINGLKAFSGISLFVAVCLMIKKRRRK